MYVCIYVCMYMYVLDCYFSTVYLFLCGYVYLLCIARMIFDLHIQLYITSV